MSIYNDKNEIDLSTILLRELPEGFKINGSLRVSNSDLTVLPKGLIIRGDLHLEDSAIEEIPDDIIVCGNIYYNNPELEYNPNYVICKDLIQIIGGREYSQCKIIDNHPFRVIPQLKIILYKDNIIPYKDILINQYKYTVAEEKYYVGIFNDYNFVTFANKYFSIVKDTGESNYKVSRWAVIESGVLEKYKDMTKSTILSLENAKQLFHDFTFACAEGIEHFVEKELPQKKDYYTIQEIIALTEGYDKHYPNTLIKEYFENGHQFVI